MLTSLSVLRLLINHQYTEPCIASTKVTGKAFVTFFVMFLGMHAVFDLKAESCAMEILSWLQAGIDAFVPLLKQSNSVENKRLFAYARNNCKRIIHDAKSKYQDRIHNRLTSHKVGSRDFWRIYNSFANKGKSSIPPLFHGPEVLTSSKDKANSTLDDSGHLLPDFAPMTNPRLDTSPITSKKVATVIARLDPSKATGPDGIPVIVLQKCSPELSPILSKLYLKMCH